MAMGWPVNACNHRIGQIMVLIIGLAGLLGCARSTWVNPNKNTNEYYTDKAECRGMSGVGAMNQIIPIYGYSSWAQMGQFYNAQSALMATFDKNETFNDCMTGRGWR